MKKLISILLALLLISAFVGCKDKNTDTNTSSTNQSDTAETEENEGYEATFTSNSFIEIDNAGLLGKGDMIYFAKEEYSGYVVSFTIEHDGDTPISYNQSIYASYDYLAKVLGVSEDEMTDEYVANWLDGRIDPSQNTAYIIIQGLQFDDYIVLSNTYKGLNDEKNPNYEGVKYLTVHQMVSDLKNEGFILKNGNMVDYYNGYIPPAIDTDKDYYADIVVKGHGTITVKLAPKTAPMTVANFVDLANKGFYNGLTFHRIIDGFMIQGGDPLGNGTGGPDTTIFGEFEKNGFKNDLKHTRGVISMARSGGFDSAGSQFFIMHADKSHLDGDYAAFGTVESGIEIVDALCEAAKPTDGNGTIASADQPVIESITIRNS